MARARTRADVSFNKDGERFEITTTAKSVAENTPSTVTLNVIADSQ